MLIGLGLLNGVLISLISGAVGGIFTYLFRRLKNVMPIKKLWRISDPKSLIICAATSTKTHTGKYVRPATGIGQVRALGAAVESLSKAYNVKIENILFSDDQVQSHIENDIIILGGPKNNIIAKLFLDKTREINDIVYQVDNTIYWNVKHEEHEFNAVENADSVVIKDYGIIIRGTNHFCNKMEKSTFCLFSGCHTYGTTAAAEYFTEVYAKRIGLFKKTSKNIIMVVECGVVDGYPVAIQLVKEHEF